MDFELSADQVALQDAARDLLDGRASPAQVRAVVDADAGFDADLWAAMVDQGWPGIAVPEALGGVGLGLVEAAVLLEQVGAHVAPAPILGQLVAADALVRASTGGGAAAEAAATWLGPLLSGASIATVAWTAVTAVPAGGDGWTLRGGTEPAVAAPLADVALVRGIDVTDPSGDGVLVGDDALFLVDLAEAGGRPVRQPAMDRTSQLGWLTFDDTPAIRLGGPEAVAAYLDVAATLLSAELLGGAARAMDLAVAYAKERHQFGQPIGSFQAVKHRCADMLVDVEGMRSVVYWAAWCLAAGDPERSVAASTAKTWCADASKRVLASALQVHGGIGFTWECDVHLFLKRGQLQQVSFGDATLHRARLASLLRARVEAGQSVI